MNEPCGPRASGLAPTACLAQWTGVGRSCPREVVKLRGQGREAHWELCWVRLSASS